MNTVEIAANRTLREWAEHPLLAPVRRGDAPPLYRDLSPEEFVATGVAAADIQAWVTVFIAGIDPEDWFFTPDELNSLRDDLLQAAQHLPTMTVRAALGWAMAGWTLPNVGRSTLALPAMHQWLRALDADDPKVADYATWLTGADGAPLVARYAETGWLACVAGLSRAETERLIRDDAYDANLLAALAGLRGCPIPRTP